MKNSGERRSIFKKGKGRAFLKFLLDELILIAVVSVCYLFLLQGDLSAFLPTPVSKAPVSTPSAVPATATPAPTPVATIAPTQAPTPAPSGTPVPYEALSLPVGEDAPEAPALPDASLKLGMNEYRAFTDAGQNVLVIGGHAFIEGLDAAKSDIYLLIADAEEGYAIEMYKAVSAPETANLSFEESSGANLSNAFFTAKIDVSEYEDASYMLSVVVVNEDRVEMNYFDTRPFHFRIVGGMLTVEE
ncbi:MAG: hypothetical protein IJE08_06835 [Clostridia bacterium]|nr:hypothetical protein [Clostridia bacterium]